MLLTLLFHNIITDTKPKVIQKVHNSIWAGCHLASAVFQTFSSFQEWEQGVYFCLKLCKASKTRASQFSMTILCLFKCQSHCYRYKSIFFRVVFSQLYQNVTLLKFTTKKVRVKNIFTLDSTSLYISCRGRVRTTTKNGKLSTFCG